MDESERGRLTGKEEYREVRKEIKKKLMGGGRFFHPGKLYFEMRKIINYFFKFSYRDSVYLNVSIERSTEIIVSILIRTCARYHTYAYLNF